MHVEYIIPLIIQEMLRPMVWIYPERGSSTKIQMSPLLGETQRNILCLKFFLHIPFKLWSSRECVISCLWCSAPLIDFRRSARAGECLSCYVIHKMLLYNILLFLITSVMFELFQFIHWIWSRNNLRRQPANKTLCGSIAKCLVFFKNTKIKLKSSLHS